MTRVSLKEAYDNKDVVAQIYAIRDTAESAEDTAEQAVTTANTASEHVDALVPQVEQAVENANTASETVAGYENRLGAVETGLSETESDLDAVTLRIQTAEGQIVTIQGRVTALETADANNVKITGTHKIGDYAVLLTGNQDPIAGEKTFANNLKQKNTGMNTIPRIYQIANIDSLVVPDSFLYLGGGFAIRDMNDRSMWSVACYRDTGGRDVLSIEGKASDDTTTGYFHFELGPNGYKKITTDFNKPSNW